MIAVWLLLGLVGAAVYVAAGRGRGLAWWAVGLVVAALAYVAFAFAAGDLRAAGAEAVGVALFGGAAAFAWRRRSVGALAVAWALHPAWDLGAHLAGGLPAPTWYVWACLSFDLAVGAALAWRTRPHTRPVSTT